VNATNTTTAPAERQGQQRTSGWRVVLLAGYFAFGQLTGRGPGQVQTAHAYNLEGYR
jgi:hypothetical protein